MTIISSESKWHSPIPEFHNSIQILIFPHISFLYVDSSELWRSNQYIFFLNLMLNSSRFFLICTFHLNVASRVIPWDFAVLGYGIYEHWLWRNPLICKINMCRLSLVEFKRLSPDSNFVESKLQFPGWVLHGLSHHHDCHIISKMSLWKHR